MAILISLLSKSEAHAQTMSFDAGECLRKFRNTSTLFGASSDITQLSTLRLCLRAMPYVLDARSQRSISVCNFSPTRHDPFGRDRLPLVELLEVDCSRRLVFGCESRDSTDVFFSLFDYTSLERL